MENWELRRGQRTPAQTILERLAGQALRLQRISLAQKLQHIEQMVQIHAPALNKQPGGAAQIKQLREKFAEARRKLLQGENDG
jgi:hypothetical protein